MINLLFKIFFIFERKKECVNLNKYTPKPVIKTTSRYKCQLLSFVNMTKKNPTIVIMIPVWRRNILEKVFPKKYQTGVEIKVIKKYKINSGPA